MKIDPSFIALEEKFEKDHQWKSAPFTFNQKEDNETNFNKSFLDSIRR